MTTNPEAVSRAPILVDFALQGGGAHGAFTWGVLDRLLEEPWLGIDGISGTSAGAMNAAVLVDGFAGNGADGARAALENFWRRVSQAAVLSPFRRSANATRTIRSSCRSIRSSARDRRARRAISSTGSTRSRSMPCCSRS